MIDLLLFSFSAPLPQQPQQRFFGLPNPFGNKDINDGLAGLAGGLAAQYLGTAVRERKERDSRC